MKRSGVVIFVMSWVLGGWAGFSIADEMEKSLREEIALQEENLLSNPDDADLHFQLGKNYFNLAGHLKERGSWILQTNKKIRDSEEGDRLFDESLKHWKEAIEIQPGHSGAHFNLGVNYFIKGRKVAALYHMKKADQLFSQYGDTRGLEKSKKTLVEWYESFGYKPELFETANR